MIREEIATAVRVMKAQGQSLREISRALKLSRNTVRRVLRAQPRAQSEYTPCDAQTLARVQACFERAGGNVVRARELLQEEHALEVGYSTLTRGTRSGTARPAQALGRIHLRTGHLMASLPLGA
jgi:predicted transcriptional regulator